MLLVPRLIMLTRGREKACHPTPPQLENIFEKQVVTVNYHTSAALRRHIRNDPHISCPPSIGF